MEDLWKLGSATDERDLALFSGRCCPTAVEDIWCHQVLVTNHVLLKT